MKINNLNTLCYAGKFTLHQYDAGDHDVEEAGYFNVGHERLKKADVIIVTKQGPATRFYTVVASGKDGVDVRRMGQEHLSGAYEKSTKPKPKDEGSKA